MGHKTHAVKDNKNERFEYFLGIHKARTHISKRETLIYKYIYIYNLLYLVIFISDLSRKIIRRGLYERYKVSMITDYSI